MSCRITTFGNILWLGFLVLLSGEVGAVTNAPFGVASAAGVGAMESGLSEEILGCIVTITGSRGAGTGFIATDGVSTCLYSNIHVLMGNSGMRFANHRGETFQPVAIEAASDRDVVRLKLRQVPKQCLAIATPRSLNVPVAVCGNAEGEEVMRVISGKIVGVGPLKVETDAQFVRGHSGSPILTCDGKVLGIATYVKRGNPDWVSTNTPFAVTRRFGFRVDNVKNWVKVDQRWFVAESGWLREREEKLTQLSQLLDAWADDPYWQLLPEETADAVHRGVSDWVRAHNQVVAANRRRLHSARPSETKASELSREFHQQLRREAEVLKQALASAWRGPRPRWHLPFFRAYADELDTWHDMLLKAVDELCALHSSYDPVVVKRRDVW
ncbi:MAG: serine protease [bacterium]|nr:serine protease [bacterium]